MEDMIKIEECEFGDIISLSIIKSVEDLYRLVSPSKITDPKANLIRVIRFNNKFMAYGGKLLEIDWECVCFSISKFENKIDEFTRREVYLENK